MFENGDVVRVQALGSYHGLVGEVVRYTVDDKWVHVQFFFHSTNKKIVRKFAMSELRKL